MHLLSRVESYLSGNAIRPTRFGREAVRDPRFVLDLRNGRRPRPPTVTRVLAWIERAEERAPCRG